MGLDASRNGTIKGLSDIFNLLDMPEDYLASLNPASTLFSSATFERSKRSREGQSQLYPLALEDHEGRPSQHQGPHNCKENVANVRLITAAIAPPAAIVPPAAIAPPAA